MAKQVTLDEYLGQLAGRDSGDRMNMIVGVREFRQHHGRSVERYWQVWLEDDFVCSAWGAVTEGKRKEHGRTKDRPGPKGKDGTKGYVDAYANARFNLERDIRKKTEQGYVEVGLDGKPLLGGIIPTASTIEWGERLRKNLCFSKPRNKTNGDFIAALEQSDDLIFTRKVNGMSVIVQVMADGEIVIYSRRMDDITGHFPHLVKAIRELKIPFCTIMMFEGYMGKGNTKRDLIKCSEIMRSKQQKALDRQKENGWMRFYLYRIPFWKAEHLEAKYTNIEWLQLLENTLSDKFLDYKDTDLPVGNQMFLHVIEVFEGSVKEAMELAEAEDYEGWVCYQASATLGDYSYSFDGKASRPACAFKMKRAATDDFIAYWDPDKSTNDRPLGTWGTGKNMGKLGTLSLYQLNKEGKETYIADCSGFTDEERERLATQKYPICVEVKYDSRFYKSQGDKTNSLDFPRYQRQRDDKTCDECIDEEL